MAPTFELRRYEKSKDLIEIRQGYTAGQKQRYFFASDIHLDNPKCDRELFGRHMKEAQDTGALVLLFGDVLDLMGGRHDKRGSKNSILPEHKVDNYWDAVIEWAAEWFLPYRDSLAIIAEGNHETAAKKHNEIDPLGRMCGILRRAGSPVEHMPYQGFVRFAFHQEKARVRRLKLFYHHGKFGGFASKGTLGGGRYASIAPDADLFVNGHNHERTSVSHAGYRMLESEVQIVDRYHLQCGTYKNEFGGGSGFGVEKIVFPKSLGGWWVELTPNAWTSGVSVSFWPAS